MKNEKTNRTIDAYDKNAKSYALKFDDFSTYKKKITDFHRKYVHKGSRILDLGCGPGNNLRTLLELDDSCLCTGVDLSTELISIAQQKCPECTFITEDICELTMDSSYDVVLASFCIVHLTDDRAEQVIQRISHWLNNNGHLYLSFMEGNTSGFESTSFSDEQIYFNYYQVYAVVEMLRKYGIHPVEIGREEYPEQDGSTTMDVFIFASRQYGS